MADAEALQFFPGRFTVHSCEAHEAQQAARIEERGRTDVGRRGGSAWQGSLPALQSEAAAPAPPCGCSCSHDPPWSGRCAWIADGRELEKVVGDKNKVKIKTTKKKKRWKGNEWHGSVSRCVASCRVPSHAPSQRPTAYVPSMRCHHSLSLAGDSAATWLHLEHDISTKSYGPCCQRILATRHHYCKKKTSVIQRRTKDQCIPSDIYPPPITALPAMSRFLHIPSVHAVVPLLRSMASLKYCHFNSRRSERRRPAY